MMGVDKSEDTHCKEVLKAPLHRFEPGPGENHQAKEVHVVQSPGQVVANKDKLAGMW